ncbi:uncharacterized protein [Elaeis guineensis]|uniref:Uncharacterized protein LOC105047220 n=1 Tax=Elaeis guineensis var. tenera TaxID=51953 RepID=A0A6I9RJU2_ELAGV|nr:uncharacterized protein LOC105047220 [Elaeis guineensis]
MRYLQLPRVTADNPTSPSSLLIFPLPSDPAMDPVKAEKETAMRRYRRLRKIAKLFHLLLEAFAALLFLSWFSARLPAAARFSGDFLRRLAAVILSPRFVFLLGNAIVLVLFAKSRHLASSADGSDGDLYDQFLESRRRIGFSPPPPTPTVASPEEVVFEDKAVCMESRPCRRSRSEKIERRRRSVELRRVVSDVGPNGEKPPPPPPAVATAEVKEDSETSADDAEEFRRTIEAFIAKQVRFLREESMAVVSAEEPQDHRNAIF